MKFTQRIRAALKAFSANPSQMFINLTNFGSHLRRRSVESDPAGNYAGWVYAAVSKRAKRVGAINLRLYELMSGDELQELTDHELLALLHKANPAQTQYQFFYTLELMLGIWGSAPVYKDRAGTKSIQYLWPLRPDMLTAITNSAGTIVGYKYSVGGRVQTLKAEDVVMVNEPSPQSIFTGFSPTLAAGLEVDADLAAATWNKHLIENFAEPGGVLTTEQKLDDKEFERLKKTWEARHAGPTNAGRWALLEKGLKAEAIGRSPKDMDLNESRRFSRNAISAILGVPMSLMTSEDVNLANAEVGERVFAKDTVEPQMKLIVGCLNESLVPEYGDNLGLMFDSPVREDVQEKINVSNAIALIATTNERREMFNLPAIEGGDSIFLPIGMMPQVGEGIDPLSVDPSLNDPNADPSKGFKVIGYKRVDLPKTSRPDAKSTELIRAIKARTFYKRKLANTLSEKTYDHILKAMHDGHVCKTKAKLVLKAKSDDNPDKPELHPRLKADRLEFLKSLPRQQKKFLRQVKKYLGDQQKLVLRNLEEFGLPKGRGGHVATKESVERWINKILFNKKQQDDALVEMAGDMYRDNIRAGSEAVAKLLGIAPSAILSTPFVVDFISDRSFLMLSVNATTRENLAATLRLGVAQGEDLGQIRNRISEVYNEAQGFRAETIARTEVGAAQNFGRTAEMENQKVEKRVWIATFSNTRDEHAEADGQVVNVGEPFNVGGESLDYPGDPSGSAWNTINCQCSVSPTLSD